MFSEIGFVTLAWSRWLRHVGSGDIYIYIERESERERERGERDRERESFGFP